MADCAPPYYYLVPPTPPPSPSPRWNHRVRGNFLPQSLEKKGTLTAKYSGIRS